MTEATLTGFLLARIAEDEAAQAMSLDAWHRADCERNTYDAGPCDCGIPARVLAECEAKRRLVDEHQETRRDPSYEYFADPPCITCGQVRPRKFPCLSLRALGAVYADHPDYNPAWSPTR